MLDANRNPGNKQSERQGQASGERTSQFLTKHELTALRKGR
jgi:hypothetical protein